MFNIEGKILMINIISDKSAQVVVEKRIMGKKTPIAINIFGFWKEKMDLLKLLPKEKIQGKVFVKSNLHKGKWYTDLYFKGIARYVQKPKFINEQNDNILFNDLQIENNYIVDEETGEILL